MRIAISRLRNRLALLICPQFANLQDYITAKHKELNQARVDLQIANTHIDNLLAAQSQYIEITRQHTTLVADQATIIKYLRDVYPDEIAGNTWAGMTFPQLVIHLINKNRSQS